MTTALPTSTTTSTRSSTTAMTTALPTSTTEPEPEPEPSTTTSTRPSTTPMTTAPPTSKTSATTTSSIGVATTVTPDPKGIISGDTVFLKTLSGNGNVIDVTGVAVRARWQSHGTWQALTIEKHEDGTVHSGDVVYFKAHTGAHIDVDWNGNVQAKWNDKGAWQAMTIVKRIGTGPIFPDDIVCLKAH